MDDGPSSSAESKETNSTLDRSMVKPQMESFLHNTEDPFIVGMITRVGKFGMPATRVDEPKFWSGQWAKKST